MPLYDYKCKKCGHIFEVQQKMMDEPLTTCPECKGEIHRLISAAGIVFKGSGFHVTDYKKSSNPASTSQPAAVSDQKLDKKEETRSTTTETKSAAVEKK